MTEHHKRHAKSSDSAKDDSFTSQVGVIVSCSNKRVCSKHFVY